MDAIEKVVIAWKRRELTATQQSIAVGKAAHQAIRARVLKTADKKSRGTLRAEILARISSRLQEEGFKAQPSHVARHVRTFAVALCYGLDDAPRLPVSVLRAFAPTLRRDTAKEEWNVKPKVETATRELWSRVAAGEISPTAIGAAVDQVLGRSPRASRPRPSVRDRAAKLIASMSAEDQRILYAALHKRFGQQTPARPRPHAQPTIPIPDQRRRAG